MLSVAGLYASFGRGYSEPLYDSITSNYRPVWYLESPPSSY